MHWNKKSWQQWKEIVKQRRSELQLREEKKGFQPRSRFCDNREGKQVRNKEAALERWTEYFSELLNGGKKLSALVENQETKPNRNTEEVKGPPGREEAN